MIDNSIKEFSWLNILKKCWGNHRVSGMPISNLTAKDLGVTEHKQFRGMIEGDHFQIGADWMDQYM